MFNFPYRLRKQSKFEVPVGPKITSAPLLKFDLDGTKIKIKIPAGNSKNYYRSSTAARNIKLTPSLFDYYITNKPGWNCFSLLFRSWDFCGDWFLGRLGRVTANLVILKPTSLKPDASFFHPSVFEAGLADNLKYRFGDEIDQEEKTQDWLVPVDWKLMPQVNSLAVMFKAERTLPNHPERMICYFSCPIDNDKILVLSCTITRFPVFINSTSTPEKNINDWVSDQPMREFVDQLLRGIQVDLSLEALQRQSKALEASPDAVLSQEFLPIKFI